MAQFGHTKICMWPTYQKWSHNSAKKQPPKPLILNNKKPKPFDLGFLKYGVGFGGLSGTVPNFLSVIYQYSNKLYLLNIILNKIV